LNEPTLNKQEIPTPALVLDLDRFEANLNRMAGHMRKVGKGLRPHAKAHKCPEIARRQIALGAIGVCCATVQEAELMASAGITGILVTSPVADPLKMARIVKTGAMVVVDHAQQAEWYAEAADAVHAKLDVLVDYDVGDHRTGAATADQVLEIAEVVERAANLRLRGLQAYSVVGSHAGGLAERKSVSKEVFRLAVETRDAMARRGFSTEILSGGSTGTWDIDTDIPELTELQAGSYVFMDMAYRKEGVDFAHALTVLATVVSANHEGFVTVDGGFKAFSTDRSFGPQAVDLPGSKHRWGGDEFSYIDVADCEHKPKLGEKLSFLPPHIDPTVNLHDRIYACRGENVEAIWPVKRLTL
jgi:3-hydroxy-D-aspartate aldolase